MFCKVLEEQHSKNECTYCLKLNFLLIISHIAYDIKVFGHPSFSNIHQNTQLEKFSCRGSPHCYSNFEIHALGKTICDLQYKFFYPGTILLCLQCVWNHCNAEKWNCCQSDTFQMVLHNCWYFATFRMIICRNDLSFAKLSVMCRHNTCVMFVCGVQGIQRSVLSGSTK